MKFILEKSAVLSFVALKIIVFSALIFVITGCQMSEEELNLLIEQRLSQELDNLVTQSQIQDMAEQINVGFSEIPTQDLSKQIQEEVSLQIMKIPVIQGPPGPRGPAGLKGPQGSIGPSGDRTYSVEIEDVGIDELLYGSSRINTLESMLEDLQYESEETQHQLGKQEEVIEDLEYELETQQYNLEDLEYELEVLEYNFADLDSDVAEVFYDLGATPGVWSYDSDSLENSRIAYL